MHKRGKENHDDPTMHTNGRCRGLVGLACHGAGRPGLTIQLERGCAAEQIRGVQPRGAPHGEDVQRWRERGKIPVVF